MALNYNIRHPQSLFDGHITGTFTNKFKDSSSAILYEYGFTDAKFPKLLVTGIDHDASLFESVSLRRFLDDCIGKYLELKGASDIEFKPTLLMEIVVRPYDSDRVTIAIQFTSSVEKLGRSETFEIRSSPIEFKKFNICLDDFISSL